MPTIEKNSNNIWLVIDARSSNNCQSSGISRYITGVSFALAQELHSKRNKFSNSLSQLKILIICQSDPADWIIQLIYKFPNLVSFWKGESDGFINLNQTLFPWYWPTKVLKKIQQMTGGQLIWLAPSNFDRPLFISNKPMASRVIQIIHDGIPFLKLKGIGFLFKRQFRILVARALHKLTYVVTVSAYSANILNTSIKKKLNSLYIMTDAIDESFGQLPKIFDKNILIQKRKLFLNSIYSNFEDNTIPNSFWVVGIGKSKNYKSWDIAFQAIDKLNSSGNHKRIWFIRIGADNKEINYYSKKNVCTEYGEIKIFFNLNLLFFPNLSDSQLSEFYSISNLLVHPSRAEGFGHTPLEAALSGLPVVYRKGNALDEHFGENLLPENFWTGVDSQYAAVWANQIERILLDDNNSDFYKGLKNSTNPREFILNFSNSPKTFKWENSARAILEIIGQDGGILDNMLHKKLNS